MRAKFRRCDATKIEKLRTLAELKCKYAATIFPANDLIDFVVIPFYGPTLPAVLCWVFAFTSEATWPRKIPSGVNGPKQTFAN
jgi:hypothetical protein